VATVLKSEQEFVMGKPQKKYDPSQEQEQGQTSQGQGRVHVDVNLDLHPTGLSSPVIDPHGFSANDALVMPEVVNQTVDGGGNMFHLDEANNALGDTKIDGASVSDNRSSFYDPTAGFSMDANLTGGDCKIDDTHMGSSAGMCAGVVSDADVALTQSAFTQTITTGANIQFNSATVQASGHGLTDDHPPL
jgi:hypothetical protein